MSCSRVLYIDDETDLLFVVSEFFKKENVLIDTCEDIKSAMNLILNNQYDIIMSDAIMPSGNGVDFLKLLKNLDFAGKLVLYTGNDKVSNSDFCDQVLHKPLRLDQLLATLKNL